MKAVIVYESMFGNTHLVADHIARGMGSGVETSVVPVGEATPETLSGADLLVVGGPTHVHGMSSHRSRAGAADLAHKPDTGLELDPDAEGPGLRDWFDSLAPLAGLRAAAFDTRMHGPAALTGRASKGIARRLRTHGAEVIAEPESFLVAKDNHLDDGECAHAQAWGAQLAQWWTNLHTVV